MNKFFSIISVYTGAVFIVSRLIREMFAGNVYATIYTEMPVVDQLFQLCLDLYLVYLSVLFIVSLLSSLNVMLSMLLMKKVRTNMDFSLEEDLYAKLIFLLRSPETLIQITHLYQEMPIERWDIDLDESTSDQKIQLMLRKLEEQERHWQELIHID